MDDPLFWRMVKDKMTGKNVVLTDDVVDVIERVMTGKYPDGKFNPFPKHQDLYSYKVMEHPIEPTLTKHDFKARLNSEKKLILKTMKGLQKAKRLKIKPQKPPERFSFNYDLWEKEVPEIRRSRRNIPPPKLPLPVHSQSYNPPEEYLFDEEEKEKWLNSEKEERRIEYMPQQYDRLRHVPRYNKFIKERYERCLDLYLCTRKRINRLKFNPDDLLPELPKPKDLYPFPCIHSLVYTGHDDVIRSIDVDMSGQFIISGSDDNSLRIWEVLTTRCMRILNFEKPVQCVKWCPSGSKSICLVVVDRDVYIINPCIGDKSITKKTDEEINLAIENLSEVSTPKVKSVVEWIRIDRENDSENWNKGIRFIVKHPSSITDVCWHYKADYFATVMPKAGHKSVMVHQLSKQNSQTPFSKSKGIVQSVRFHPSKPLFFVATLRHVKMYDLQKQKLVKKLHANSNHVSSMAIHPGGENLILGCFDLRVSWLDLEMQDKPYKTMKFHKKGIRSVAFHKRYPLFASASDDGSTIITHGMVYDDWNQNALIVPVKVLKGHKITDDLGVMDCCFHPDQPWVFSAGADATIRLYTH